MWGPCCWGYVSWVVKDMCVVMGVNKVNSNPVQLTQSWVKFASLRGVWQQSKMWPSTTQEIVQVNIFWKGIQTIRPSPTVTSSLQPSQQLILPQISTVWSSQPGHICLDRTAKSAPLLTLEANDPARYICEYHFDQWWHKNRYWNCT